MKIINKLYQSVSLIRQAELKIVEVYPSDIIQCPVHLSIGQEAIAVALSAHLRKGDFLLGTHRSHALYLANGGDLKKFFAELLGKVEGCSGGYGGSMHLIDLEHGLLGTSSIVGGILPIGIGVSFGLKPSKVVALLFGDGACDEGIFYESLSFAELRKVPVIFLCENNRYSVYTHIKERRTTPAWKVAQCLGINSLFVPIKIANDAVELYKILQGPIERLRKKGNGPLFIECETVRALDHHGIESDIKKGFRPITEELLFKKYCPLVLTGRHINGEKAKEIDQRNRKRVEKAFSEALKSKSLRLKVKHEELGHLTRIT